MVKKHEVTDPFFVWAGLPEDSKRVHLLMRSEVFNPIHRRHIYFWSALTEILIHTRSLIGHAEEEWGCQLAWCNEFRGEYTIKDHIIGFRDALCHSTLWKVKKQQQMQLWVKNVIIGKKRRRLRLTN